MFPAAIGAKRNKDRKKKQQLKVKHDIIVLCDALKEKSVLEKDDEMREKLRKKTGMGN